MFDVPTHPAHPALILDDRVLDYATVAQQRDQVAAALQRDGLKPGDVAAICAATSMEYVITFLGCLRAGVVVAPLGALLLARAFGGDDGQRPGQSAVH